MNKVQLLYHNKEILKKTLNESDFNNDCEILVRIYTANCTKEDAVKIALEVKELLPNSKIIGCSGSGVIYCGKQYDNRTIIIIEKFANAKVLVREYSFKNTDAHILADNLSNDVHLNSLSFMHLLCGGHYTDIHKFIDELNSKNTSVNIAGGIAGDILSKNIIGYVFTENGVIPDGVVCAAIIGENVKSFCTANISHTPISPYYKIDKTNDSLLLQIEGKSAVDWCREQFGMEHITEYSDWQLIAENDALIRFPLILEGHGGASRFIKFSQDAQEMSLYFSRLDDNIRFKIGYTSPIACAQQCFEICNELTKVPIESIFCYTCLFRKLYLGNCAEWELRPFSKMEICGVFMMGEISSLNGKNEFLNGSCSFISVAENDVYIEPDFTVFDDLYKIKDDNEKLVNYVLQKQSTAMSRENEELLAKLLMQQSRENEKLFIDPNSGLSNSFKYAQDNIFQNFDKMCMVHIENYDLLVAVLGQSGYYNMLEKIVNDIRVYTGSTIYHDKIFYYILNSSTLFMATNQFISDAQFIEIANDYFTKYQIIKSPNGEDLMINRFVLILHQEDLLASGLRTLHKCKNLQSRFVISNDSMLDTPELNREMKMIHILNDVIANKKVIPYFQGIYDNRSECINEYEALMRIEDEDGNIYAPGSFMNIAKKYHMYGSISRLMLEKVFELFSGRKETVGINLSASDINYDEMQEFIFSELEKMGNANNIVFELLEDESFRDMEKLQPFIDKVRSYGVKVAIDDFGSGYSNFMQILLIEPDYIKIDMSIVQHIDSSTLSQKVLENISFLGRQLNAKLVAEGVETRDIQGRLENMNVHFSQGFLFARPVPFDNLNI